MPPPKTPQELHDEIASYYDDFNFGDEAQAAYKQLLQRAKKDGNAYYYLGLLAFERHVYFENGRVVATIIDPDTKKAQKKALSYFAKVGTKYLTYNDAQAKIKEIKSAQESLKGQTPKVLYKVLLDYYRNNQDANAIETYKALRKKAQSDSGAYYYLGILANDKSIFLKRNGSWSEDTGDSDKDRARALTFFAKVSPSATTYPGAQLDTAWIYSDQEKYRPALKAYRLAVNSLTDKFDKEEGSIKKAEIKEKLEEAQKFIREAYDALAEQAKEHKKSKAFRLLRKESNAGYLLAMAHFGDTLYHHRKFAAAAEQYTSILDRINLASKYSEILKQETIDEARELFDATTKSLKEVFKKAGEAAEQKNKRALSALKKYSAKNNLTAKVTLGEVYFNRGDYIKAEKEYAAVRKVLFDKEDELTKGEKTLLKKAHEKLNVIYPKLAKQVKEHHSKSAHRALKEARTLGAGEALAGLYDEGFTVKKGFRGKEKFLANKETATALRSKHVRASYTATFKFDPDGTIKQLAQETTQLLSEGHDLQEGLFKVKVDLLATFKNQASLKKTRVGESRASFLYHSGSKETEKDQKEERTPSRSYGKK